MTNLHDGDVLLPPDPDAARALKVVPVHDYVDSEVQGDDNPRYRGATDELSVTEEGSRAMVIRMEEG